MDIVFGIILGAAATLIVGGGLYITRGSSSDDGDGPSSTSRSGKKPGPDPTGLKS